MSLKHTVTVGTLAVTVRELTVREVRDWATLAEQGLIEVDPIQHLALDEYSIADILMMSDATAEELDGLSPSEFGPLIEACRKLNPHFFRVRTAMSGAAVLMAQQAQQFLSSEPA